MLKKNIFCCCYSFPRWIKPFDNFWGQSQELGMWWDFETRRCSPHTEKFDVLLTFSNFHRLLSWLVLYLFHIMCNVFSHVFAPSCLPPSLPSSFMHSLIRYHSFSFLFFVHFVINTQAYGPLTLTPLDLFFGHSSFAFVSTVSPWFCGYVPNAPRQHCISIDIIYVDNSFPQ